MQVEDRRKAAPQRLVVNPPRQWLAEKHPNAAADGGVLTCPPEDPGKKPTVKPKDILPEATWVVIEDDGECQGADGENDNVVHAEDWRKEFSELYTKSADENKIASQNKPIDLGKVQPVDSVCDFDTVSVCRHISCSKH